MTTVKSNKKLIEVALPLEAINTASAREKSIRHGHPSTLHLWWARRPLAAARAVIFAQMVDDPSALPDLFPTEKKQEKERQRLFKIIEELVQWENTTNEEVLDKARSEIWQSWRRTCSENADDPRAKELFDRNILPAFHDPFAGGGALPLEAQRLGLESYASDLNPVAVLINKSMIEIPPKFAGKSPINPEFQKNTELFHREWKGAQGLAEDVRYYGHWMRKESERRIGNLYPKIVVTDKLLQIRPDLKKYVGKELTIIAWLWARTVKSPNPAFAQVEVPLVSNFMLSAKLGKEAYVHPVIENGDYQFTVKVGKPKDVSNVKLGTTLGKRAAFRCLMSDTPITYEYIREQGKAGKLGTRLMAIVAEGDRGRVYFSPTQEQEDIAESAKPTWKPETPLHGKTRVNVSNYGFDNYGDLFTNRQLFALTTFADLVSDARELALSDAQTSGFSSNGSFSEGDNDAIAYADSIAVYLAFAVDRLAMTGNSLVRWNNVGEKAQHCFGRQALPMLWDFAEPNFLATATGSIEAAVFYSYDPLNWMRPASFGWSSQEDAATQVSSKSKVVSTDPPYYDNIAYADLSDFFYVWLRRSLRSVFSDLFATLAVPKTEELVATPYRHGSKEKAEAFFLTGMTKAMYSISEQAHPAFPVTIYYAFKQAESDDERGTTNTGWDTFLEAVIKADFAISGTWPIRTEMKTRQIAMGVNALASSIVLVCRKKVVDAPSATRREFVNALKAELPNSLIHLQRGNIAPVDLAQAAIGPGMSVFTRYASVLDVKGTPMTVREALALINETLDEALAQQEGDFDADSRWALTWFEQFGFAEGEYGVAEQLSKSKNTSVDGMVHAGILESKRGKVHLLKPEELQDNWDPTTDSRLTHWETVHQLIRVLETGGEGAAAELVYKLGGKAETARELCYRLYTICERKKRNAEALAYNGLVQSWPEIVRLSIDNIRKGGEQTSLFNME